MNTDFALYESTKRFKCTQQGRTQRSAHRSQLERLLQDQERERAEMERRHAYQLEKLHVYHSLHTQLLDMKTRHQEYEFGQSGLQERHWVERPSRLLGHSRERALSMASTASSADVSMPFTPVDEAADVFDQFFVNIEGNDTADAPYYEC